MNSYNYKYLQSYNQWNQIKNVDLNTIKKNKVKEPSNNVLLLLYDKLINIIYSYLNNFLKF